LVVVFLWFTVLSTKHPRLQAVPNAKAYQAQFANGTGPWQEAGIYPNTRGIILTKSHAGNHL
jgi:hypothetical protein